MNPETFDYQFSVPIQIKISDLDPFNHVNNGDQCHYFDYGRSQYFEHVYGHRINWLTFDLVIVHLDLDFHNGIELQDKIVCKSKVLEIGNKSFKMVQQLVDEESGIVKTTCHSVICGFDRKNLTSIPLKEEYKTKMKAFEGIA